MKKTILLPISTMLIVSALLFAVSGGLSGIEKTNAAKARLEKMQTLLPGSTEFTKEVYTGEDANIRSVHKAENGYVIETSVYGYAGDITMLIGVNNAGRVVGMVVTDMAETFGLGANALSDHEFLKQFLTVNTSVVVDTGSETDAFSSATGTTETADSVSVDAITGATVTSKAVAKSINSAIAFVTGADVETSATSDGW